MKQKPVLKKSTYTNKSLDGLSKKKKKWIVKIKSDIDSINNLKNNKVIHKSIAPKYHNSYKLNSFLRSH